MEELLRLIYADVSGICPEAYLSWNTRDPVIYPYIVYDVRSTPLDRNEEMFSVPLDLFDCSESHAGLLILEDRIKDALVFSRELTDELFMAWIFIRSDSIRTVDEKIQHRQVQFNLRVDWRLKKYGRISVN
jgi:hypothetical protein